VAPSLAALSGAVSRAALQIVAPPLAVSQIVSLPLALALGQTPPVAARHAVARAAPQRALPRRQPRPPGTT